MGDIKRALARVGVAGAVGAVVAPLCVVVLGAILFMGGSVLVALLFGVLVAALFAVPARVAPETSWLTGSRGGRFVWGLLVGDLGIGLWALAWRAGDEAGLGISSSGGRWLPVGAVPFALVAGMLLRRWYLALTSLALAVGIALLLLAQPAAAQPPEPDHSVLGQAWAVSEP
ncbi:hypothetical protein V5P93_002153 [Actinokineospora auranticolor]|uniref:Uncharacterized protein n=1 Tax=Actinokineospora auranticolor TaxID=155976 RepID=A0A2S6GBL8_9PSEU|nr:hypothetical protein [Actinokineospora auranticolor]PPK60992.1 hypothetical protein CLV40_1456 [Actinokineospora auranticolor]